MPSPPDNLLERARRFLRRLFTEEAASADSPTSGPGSRPIPPPGPPPAAPVSGTGAHLISHPPSEKSAILRARRAAAEPQGTGDEEDPGPTSRRFLLSVDGAGQILAVIGERMTVGHLRAGRADLPFLADVGARHAELRRSESLRAGSVWRIRPLGGETVRVDGRPIGEGGGLLRPDALVELGENLAFRFRTPDSASRTVLLELEGGVECGGAKTIALFGEGKGGRLRIGAAEQRHIRVANLEHEISLVAEGEQLQVRCDAGVCSPEESTSDLFSLACPPPQRVDLQVGKTIGGRPPFSLVISPVDLPGFTTPEGETR